MNSIITNENIINRLTAERKVLISAITSFKSLISSHKA